MLTDEQKQEAQKEACKIAKFFIRKFLMAGRAYLSGKSFEDVDKEELKLGISVEMEHTKSPMIAARIALDHLTECSTYYSRLAKMEEACKTDADKED